MTTKAIVLAASLAFSGIASAQKTIKFDTGYPRGQFTIIYNSATGRYDITANDLNWAFTGQCGSSFSHPTGSNGRDAVRPLRGPPRRPLAGPWRERVTMRRFRVAKSPLRAQRETVLNKINRPGQLP